jgi:inner membrane protein
LKPILLRAAAQSPDTRKGAASRPAAILALPWLCLAAVFLVDFGARRCPPTTTAQLGTVDEVAHEATAILTIAAVCGLAPKVFKDPGVVAAAVGAIVIDLDHVPQLLGYDFLTRGTERPYTHSLLTPAVLGAAALACPARRRIFIGLSTGVGIHFLRDVATGPGIPLAFPLSKSMVLLPYGTYAAVLGAFAARASFRARAPRR